LVAILAPRPAYGYRPFDQTDADVAPRHELELELGPVAYLWQSTGGTFAPGFVINYGLVDRIELVFDAHKSFLFGGPQVEALRRQQETALLAKGVLRKGSLQEGTGPSVAAEAGLLLPTLPIAGGPGASLAFIASQRWPALAIHLNVEGDLLRDGRFAFIGGGIFEGPQRWIVRPAAEFFAADQNGVAVVSGLAAAIWRATPDLSFDVASRLAHEAGERVVEIRAGLTWSFGL
jgi:hypothetical protein